MSAIQFLHVPIVKVDAAQRLVYGAMALQELDKSGEIFHYDRSKPFIKEWSDEMHQATGGKSYGNLRAMHGKVAAGLLTELKFDDDNQTIYTCGKVVDDNEWQKVEAGVYTGFSIGGTYAERWVEKGSTYYAAKPSEVSLVDNPCMPGAHFQFIKGNGMEEERPFTSVLPIQQETPKVTVTNDQVVAYAQTLAKAAGSDKFADFIGPAREELTKQAGATGVVVEQTAAPQEQQAAAVVEKVDAPATTTTEGTEPDPRTLLKQVWLAPDGKTFEKKAEGLSHVSKVSTPAGEMEAALAAAAAALEKVDAVPPPHTGVELHAAPMVGDMIQLDVQGQVKVTQMPKITGVDGNTVTITSADGTVSMLADWAKDYPTMSVSMVDSARVWASSMPVKMVGATLRKAADKPYGDVKYADPGYQTDKKKRYPIDTPEHIRSAWSYINKPANAAKYGENASKVKSAIVAAWKDKIDKSGPPEAKADKADFAAVLQKGLHDASRMICIIEDLYWLQNSLAYEAAYEDDGSAIPSQVQKACMDLATILKNIVAEETSEMFENKTMVDGGELPVTIEILELAAGGIPRRNWEALVKYIGQDAGLEKMTGGNLIKVVRAQADKDKVQAMHDHSVDLGATCAMEGAPGDKEAKKFDSGSLQKMATENETMRKTLETAIPLLKSMTERLERIERAPAAAPRPVRTQVVEKGADGMGAAPETGIAQAAELLKSMDPGVLATAAISLSHRTGGTRLFGAPGTNGR
jgi:hypothetical protein